MGIEELSFSLIGSLGFPIFITIYVLTNLKKSNDKLADAIKDQTAAFNRICDKFEVK